MNASEERRRIVDMLAAGRITADQAAALLEAGGAAAGARAAELNSKGTSRLLRISVDASGHDGGKDAAVRVNVPLGLAKFAGRFLPPAARRRLEAQGIDLAALLESLDSKAPDGKLVDLDATDEDTGASVRIVIEVV